MLRIGKNIETKGGHVLPMAEGWEQMGVKANGCGVSCYSEDILVSDSGDGHINAHILKPNELYT